MKAITTTFLFAFVVGTSAFGSGFVCEGEGYNVKLYNHVSGATRTPAMMILSHEDAAPKTLLKRGAGEISKTNRANVVRYTVEGNKRSGVDTVILQIAFKEGREVLAKGETVPGQLILVDTYGERSVIDLECSRYLAQ